MVIALLALTACARGLTPNEDAFASALFGDSLERSAVSIRVGVGLHTLPRPAEPEPAPEPAPDTATPEPRPELLSVPRGFCTRTPQPRRSLSWPAAFVLYDNIFFKPAYYAPDSAAGWPEAVPLPSFLIMAHELVHVWQWQNRARTGYSPSRSAAEAGIGIDPYYWQNEAARTFLSRGFEQQAAMVEDYLCYRLFEPDAPRLAELFTIINPVLPLAGLEAILAR